SVPRRRPTYSLSFLSPPPTSEIYTLSLHDALPIFIAVQKLPHETVNFGGIWHSDTTYLERPPMGTMLIAREIPPAGGDTMFANRSEEHTSELQSRFDLVCRLLLEKKKRTRTRHTRR